MAFTTDNTRWHAVVTRDPRADCFVYGVSSTGIYCRPTCAARLARRANVHFYDSSMDAEAAGYRACKRCKPRVGPRLDPQGDAVAKACRILSDHFARKMMYDGNDAAARTMSLKELADKVSLTPSYLHKTFKARTGLTPKQYASKLERQAPATSLEDASGRRVSLNAHLDKSVGEIATIPDLDDFDVRNDLADAALPSFFALDAVEFDLFPELGTTWPGCMPFEDPETCSWFEISEC